MVHHYTLPTKNVSLAGKEIHTVFYGPKHFSDDRIRKSASGWFFFGPSFEGVLKPAKKTHRVQVHEAVKIVASVACLWEKPFCKKNYGTLQQRHYFHSK